MSDHESSDLMRLIAEAKVDCKLTQADYIVIGSVAQLAAARIEHWVISDKDVLITEGPVGRVSLLQAHAELKPERRIILPPGVRFSGIARAVLTPRAYRKHVMVAVSEMQAEYIEEVRAGNGGKARWVSIRGHALIFWTLLRAMLPARVRSFLSG